MSEVFCLSSLTKDKSLDWFELKAFADDILHMNQKTKFCFGKGRKHRGKRRKCCLPAFSSFSHSVFKTLFSPVRQK